MVRYLFIVAVLCLISASSQAQNINDALRYSRNFNVGSARYNAMGGAFGALGGDPSVIHSNPAGLAVFKRNEISFTPSIFLQQSNTNYLNSEVTDGVNNFNFGHLSYTSVDNKNVASGILNSTWQVSYNRTNNFHSQTVFQGDNFETSILDGYLFELDQNLIPIEEINQSASLNTALAWETFLIDTIITNNGANYQYIVNLESFDAFQRKEIQTSGSQGAFNVAYSGNYNNRLLFGGNLTISTLNYAQTSTYTEDYPTEDTLNRMQLIEEFDNDGVGIGAILGLIYRINDYYRVGVSYHTPITYSITERFESQMLSEFRGSVGTLEATSGIFENTYSVKTPWRLQFSGAAILGKQGLVSVEYEIVDYSKMRLEAVDFSYDSENNFISRAAQVAHNFRVGGEARLSNFAIRGGYRFNMNPYESDFSDASSHQHAFSIGGGFRKAGFYTDLSYVFLSGSNQVYLYDPAFSQPATNNYRANRLSASIGFRWL